MKDLVSSFLMRHQNSVNASLHVIGIPLTIVGVVQLFMKRWMVGLLCILAGYLLQYLGHLLFEHNQMGEWILIMNLLKKITG